MTDVETTASFELVIRISAAEETLVVFVRPAPGLTVAGLIDELLVKLNLAGDASTWVLLQDATTLRREDDIEQAIAAAGVRIVRDQPIHLRLESIESSHEEVPECGDNADTLSGDGVCFFGEASDECYELGADAAAEDVRRATVRYYSRMRPERVYPLLVIITSQFVETVRKSGTDQRSSEEFTVRTDAPIEIEPILPGCDCYPPRITALLESDDATFSFRVVPSAVGRLEGASIIVRQGYVKLASVDLDVRVIPHTHALVSGFMTFALPAASTVMQRLGLDFAPHPDQGFNAYLSVAHLLFDCLTPLWLTACLGGVTTAIWWLGRPRVRDVFYDVETITPDEKLQRLRIELTNGVPGAQKELERFVGMYPANFPARLMKARHEVRADRTSAALEDYLEAFALGTAATADYEAAYRLSRKEGTPADVLQVLERAYAALGRNSMPPRLLYNLACFRALAGDDEAAMQALSDAFAFGYSNVGRVMSDADLRSLRQRADFKALIAKATAVG